MTISSNTPNRIAFGVGTITVDDTDVGATTKEGTFVIEPEVYFPSLGGSQGNIEGTGRIISERARITMTLTELDVAKLSTYLPLATCGCDGTSYSTNKDTLGAIGTSHHRDIVWTGARADGKAMEIHLDNCLLDGGLTLNMTDDSEFQYELTFVTHQDATDYNKRAWAIYIEA